MGPRHQATVVTECTRTGLATRVVIGATSRVSRFPYTDRSKCGRERSTDVRAMTIFSVMPTRTIAYLRVSTDKQADKGVSLAAQRAKIEAYAVLYDLQLVDVVVDAGESAKSLGRPGLQRALGALRDGRADALLVVKLDRLTRSVRDLGDLVDRYFADGRRALLSVSEQIDTRTAAGRLVLNVLGSVSQWERETIGERTREALAHKRSKRQKTGGFAPYGFDAVDGCLRPNASEQQVVDSIRRLRGDGHSLRSIVATLALRNVVGRTGRPLALTQIARILSSGWTEQAA